MNASLDEQLDHISRHAFMDEAQCVQALLEHTAPFEEKWDAVVQSARADIERLRSEGMGVSVESFLQEYGLSTREGVAIMCLAEALLRIPDTETADKLIESTFADGDWESHIGNSDSVYVNAASWGLLLTGKLIGPESQPNEGIGGTMRKLMRSSSEPVIRQALRRAMKLAASQFVMGETIEDSLKKAKKFEKKGYRFSYDMLGEGARSMAQADRYFQSYMKAIKAVGQTREADEPLYEAPSVSIKLTALHPRYEWRHQKQIMQELLPKLKQLTAQAQALGIGIAIDAEEATRLDIELEVFRALFLDPDFSDYAGIGFVLQAYQKRALPVIDFLVTLSQRSGKRIPVRLVKGAYWDSEIKVAQVNGLLDYPVFTVKEHSDVSYLACAKKLLEHPYAFFPQFASHNALTLSAIKMLASQSNCDFEFQRLYGMGEKLYETIVADYPSRIYAPIGEHQDLLAYLIRRLLENGANSSFVNVMLDENVPVEALLQSPIGRVRDTGGHARIAPPAQLYGDARHNSRGYDLGNRMQMQQLLADIAEQPPVPAITPADEKEVEDAIANAKAAFADWNRTPADARAGLLEHTANLLEQHETELLALVQREGKKTLADAIAELREAIDFCRYYALQCRVLFSNPIILDGPTGEHNQLSLHGRGVFACISPWNFPLAIFVGQVTAALAAGNTVLAKPAEQTSAIAARAVELMHDAGIPKHVVQLISGEGRRIGPLFTRDERINGIAFTGSTNVAKQLQKELAERDGAIIPLIAETGGQNAMIVDSSALLEQAVDDIIYSAFGSAGQRCSALRVLYVHESIAEPLCELISGAMQALHVGDATRITTDVAPVIDAKAQANLKAHIDDMTRNGKLIAAAPLPADVTDTFVQPHAFEISSISQLTQEHFGPILHVIRYSNIADAVREIESTGFGLTFGIHSRIPNIFEPIAERIHAGNVYVNRGMTGAVVGVQPFGGEGLSGTGPKAGSPYTLLRFASEKAISINTAAIGGNIDLLMK